jgi:hypothetical protein
MRTGMPRAAPIRLCGKTYESVAEAERSAAGRRPGAVIETWCPCGAVHVRQPPASAPVLASRRRDKGPSLRGKLLALERDGNRCACCGGSVKEESGQDPALIPVTAFGSRDAAWPTDDGGWVYEAPAGAT